MLATPAYPNVCIRSMRGVENDYRKSNDARALDALTRQPFFPVLLRSSLKESMDLVRKSRERCFRFPLSLLPPYPPLPPYPERPRNIDCSYKW